MIRGVLRRPARFVRQQVMPRLFPASRGSMPEDVREVRVVGLLSSASGFGKSARLCVEALLDAGFAVTTSDVSGLFGIAAGLPYRQNTRTTAVAGVSIYHLNPPKLLPGVLGSGFGRYRSSYNIGYWAWELETLPPEWVGALKFVDAVLVPSTFCRDAVSRYTGKPVLVIPHPLRSRINRGAPETEPQPTQCNGAPFTVLNIFSFGSSFERKNPVALVRAFRIAFGDDPAARLVLKTTDAEKYPGDLETLRREIRLDPRIVIYDEVWSEARLAAELRSADVYASLHRSEGFGLTIAEAILAEVPIVATAWSGNMDYCDAELMFPVRYALIPFRDSHPDFAAVQGARWADPSAEHAAEQLRAVRRDPSAARDKARRQKAHFEKLLADRTYGSALELLGGVSAAAVSPALRPATAAPRALAP